MADRTASVRKYEITHVPVMAAEVANLLPARRDGVYVDGTIGAGGHARALLEKLGPRGFVIGIDRDRVALALAEKNLAPWRGRFRLVRGNFAEMRILCGRMGIERADGIILDIGMSSMQVDCPERGFSFMRNGPLDMRMDREAPLSAAGLIERLDEDGLERVIRTCGEERRARRIARAIVAERARGGEWTTARLARTVEKVVPREGGSHPATRTFQALRIAVNDELGALEKGIEEGLLLLAAGGRMAVISYHSLEDRAVKRIFAGHIGRMVSLPQGGANWEGLRPAVRPIVKKVLRPAEEEVALNPRARSAKMRCVERVE